MGSQHRLHYQGGRVGKRGEWDLLCSLFGQLLLHLISSHQERKHPITAHRVQVITGRLL